MISFIDGGTQPVRTRLPKDPRFASPDLRRPVTFLELRIPPVALAVVFAAVMWSVSTQLPTLAVALPWRLAGSLAGAFVGGFFAVAGILAFRQARTTVNPTRPGEASSVVAFGIYRTSRNPMYVGLAFMLSAWAVFLSSAPAFVLVPAFVAYMTRFQILPEERALAAKFGSSYVDYMHSVRRWL